MKKRNLYQGILLCTFATALAACGEPGYKDPSRPIESRVQDLLGRMTLEEKAAQLDMLSAKEIVVDEKTLAEDKLEHFVDSMCIGAVHDLYPAHADIANLIQKHAVENSRLGIPLLFIEEGLHGYQGAGATAFPIPIGNSSSWDTELLHNIGRVIGTEARAHGVHFILGPNLDLAREIRWGRVEETFGEDPYLTSRMGVNLIQGMQGESLSDNNTVAAEPKHFGIHGIPESGTNASSVNIGEREARSTHLYTFEKAITEGKAQGVMAAYHDLDGIPCVANPWLLTQVLRNEWGFNGIVVSDLGAIRRQISDHHTAADAKEAITKSLNAGLNMQFYDFPYEDFQAAVVQAVKDGTLDEKALDSRVADVLRLKFKLGLFDNPYTDPGLVAQVDDNKKHKEIALDASRKSLILLKNEDSILPFRTDIKRITLVGELANQSLLGGYSPAQVKAVTVYEALKQKFGKNVQINYIESQVENGFKSIPNSALYTEAGGDNGIFVEYFNNTELSGNPAYTSTDTEISHYWHNLSPVPGVNRDYFSARWKGWVRVPETGEYEFKLSADNWGKLYLNNRLVIDQWNNDKRNGTYRIRLQAGQMLPIQVEYAELDENAGLSAEWRLTDRTISTETLCQRVKASAMASDITIVVVGETMNMVGEGKDRQNLNMNERDIRLMQAIEETGKPSATVLMHGRPFVLTPVEEHSHAILDAWYPGECGGTAIVEALFGDINPSGKLTVSVPRYQGQTPVHYMKKRSFKRSYVDGNATPLYPFGYGLSYTTFEYSGLQLSAQEIRKNENLKVTFNVKNTGKVKGTEICQVYLTDEVSSVSLPGKALKGFCRVELAPGEEKSVEIELTPEHFSLINAEMQRVVEPGTFLVQVGASSANILLKEKVTVLK